MERWSPTPYRERPRPPAVGPTAYRERPGVAFRALRGPKYLTRALPNGPIPLVFLSFFSFLPRFQALSPISPLTLSPGRSYPFSLSRFLGFGFLVSGLFSRILSGKREGVRSRALELSTVGGGGR
jgi:hypothetical protein